MCDFVALNTFPDDEVFYPNVIFCVKYLWPSTVHMETPQCFGFPRASCGIY